MKLGILTDYPTLAVQSGPSIHTRFLHDGMSERGHDVTLVGPDTSSAAPIDTGNTWLFHGIAYPSHPKVKVMMPRPLSKIANAPKFDVIHGQVNGHHIELANFLRRMHRTAVLNTNIIHLPAHCHMLVNDTLWQNPVVRTAMQQWAGSVERDFAKLYNQGDAFIVQSRYMVDYWRERGVTVPIEVVGRPIDPARFSRPAGNDPYPEHFVAGKRLVVVCRHDREKDLDVLLRYFDEQIAEADPEVTLTLIGHGHENQNLIAQAKRGRHADRVFFPGEVPHATLVDWYTHADLFVYTSLSETFGNVVNEALWTGLPVVALDDHMGVAHQVMDGVNGYLVEPGRGDSGERFTQAVLRVLHNRALGARLGANAATFARRVSHPDVVISRFEGIYERAIRRAHDEIREPLSQRGTVAQRAAMAKHVSGWARNHYLMLAVNRLADVFGQGRSHYYGTDGVYRPDAPSVAPVPVQRQRTWDAAE